MPFHLKQRVLDAALMSAILYSCETWITNNMHDLVTHYMSAVKLLLGVRHTTTNILCLIELGYPELGPLIMKRQVTFISKFVRQSTGDEPLSIVLAMCAEHNTPGHRFLQSRMNYQGDPVLQNIVSLKEQCNQRRETSTRFDTYLDINPQLDVHSVYRTTVIYTPDYIRVAFTRFRLSSHRLRIETGRWRRVKREDRLCVCTQGVQDEAHVIFRCPNTLGIRQTYNICSTTTWTDLFRMNNICQIIYEILKTFQ